MLLGLPWYTRSVLNNAFLPVGISWSTTRDTADPRWTIIPRKPLTTPSPTGYDVSHMISINSGKLDWMVALATITAT